MAFRPFGVRGVIGRSEGPVLEDNSSDSKSIIELSAQRAAKQAADEYVRELRSGESGFAAFAVYAWAVVALIGSSIGATALLFPGESSHIQIAQQEHPKQSGDGAIDFTTTATMSVPEPAAQTPADSQNVETGSGLSTGATSAVPSADGPPLGAQLGKTASIDEIVLRHIALDNRSPWLFAEHPPLVRFFGSGDAVVANLVVGPFDSKTALDTFCGTLARENAVSCTAAPYEGDPFTDD